MEKEEGISRFSLCVQFLSISRSHFFNTKYSKKQLVFTLAIIFLIFHGICSSRIFRRRKEIVLHLQKKKKKKKFDYSFILPVPFSVTVSFFFPSLFLQYVKITERIKPYVYLSVWHNQIFFSIASWWISNSEEGSLICLAGRDEALEHTNTGEMQEWEMCNWLWWRG